MTVRERCSCGAEIEARFEASGKTYGSYGQEREAGLKQLDVFRRRHKDCGRKPPEAKP